MKRLGEAKETEVATMQEIEFNLETKRSEAETEIVSLNGQIASRRQELADLMKPIHEIRKEADQRLLRAGERERENELAGETLEKDRLLLTERIEAIVDREQEAERKDNELGERERKIENREKIVDSSEKSLKEKWVEYHEKVNITNLDLKRREKEVEDGKRANNAIRKNLEAEAERQTQERRALQDGWKTLERSKKRPENNPINT